MRRFIQSVNKVIFPVFLLIFIVLNFVFYYLNSSPSVLHVPICITFVLVLISFTQCIITHPGKVPLYFDFLEETYRLQVSHADYKTDLRSAYSSFCEKCLRSRPARAHHCSSCQVCVLKRDHHCMWINNCVGLNNHKHFFHLLFYGAVTAGMAVCTQGELVERYEEIAYWQSFGFLLNLGTSISLSLISSYNLWLVLTNHVMFDLRWGIFHSPFDVSIRSNLDTQFGKALAHYLLPVTPVLSQLFAPMRLEKNNKIVELIENKIIVLNKE